MRSGAHDPPVLPAPDGTFYLTLYRDICSQDGGLGGVPGPCLTLQAASGPARRLSTSRHRLLSPSRPQCCLPDSGQSPLPPPPTHLQTGARGRSPLPQLSPVPPGAEDKVQPRRRRRWAAGLTSGLSPPPVTSSPSSICTLAPTQLLRPQSGHVLEPHPTWHLGLFLHPSPNNSEFPPCSPRPRPCASPGHHHLLLSDDSSFPASVCHSRAPAPFNSLGLKRSV